MLIEISYLDGRCPLCGGTASQIDHIDDANDIDTAHNKLSYMNVVMYGSRCSKCSFLWYVRAYSCIDDRRNGFASRRNYVDHVDYNAHKELFVDMAYTKEGIN